MIRKYHNHKPQTTPWHHEEEPLNHHETPGRQRTSDTLIGYLPIFQMLPKTSVSIRYHWFSFG